MGPRVTKKKLSVQRIFIFLTYVLIFPAAVWYIILRNNDDISSGCLLSVFVLMSSTEFPIIVLIWKFNIMSLSYTNIYN